MTVLVPHRPSTVRPASLGVMADGGVVREPGSHGEADAAGLYAEPYQTGARAYA